MPRRPQVPDALRNGPFTRADARRAGLTDRQLQSRCWRRVFPGVWVWNEYPMSGPAWRRAAVLALPSDARLTGITRLQELGLDAGPTRPLRFVVARDHHASIDGIVLHRTDRMPPVDDVGVTPSAAFLAVCAVSTVMFAACVGDWMLHHQHLDLGALRELARRERWRAGAGEALWISRHLDGGSRSLPETAWRLRLEFAGLPRPEANVPIRDSSGAVIAVGDLAYPRWDTLAEYEGGHHQSERKQYLTDLARYADLRALGLSYVQLTRETTPVAGVVAVHRALRTHGYDGPHPSFGARWRLLGRRLSLVARSGARSTQHRRGEVDHVPLSAGKG